MTLKMKRFVKELKIMMGSLDIKWRPLFLAKVIDIRKDDQKTQKEKKQINIFFGTFFCIIALLVAATYFPDVKKMISSFFLIGYLYISFCATNNSLDIKKNNSGRKTKQKTGSFQELFYSPSVFTNIDCYVRNHYSSDKMMSTSDCRCLLDIIIEKELVRDKSLDPMVTLFRKQYHDLLPNYVNRAFTKVKFSLLQKQEMSEELFQNGSKK